MAKRSPTHFMDLYSSVNRRLRAVVADGYADLEIGVTQAGILRRLGENASMSQADLARALGSDPAATGRALRTLLARGWIRRRRSRGDRRAFALELTDEGRGALGRVQARRTALAKRIVACLDERDVVAFERIAKKLLTAFEG